MGKNENRIFGQLQKSSQFLLKLCKCREGHTNTPRSLQQSLSHFFGRTTTKQTRILSQPSEFRESHYAEISFLRGGSLTPCLLSPLSLQKHESTKKLSPPVSRECRMRRERKMRNQFLPLPFELRQERERERNQGEID